MTGVTCACMTGAGVTSAGVTGMTAVTRAGVTSMTGAGVTSASVTSMTGDQYHRCRYDLYPVTGVQNDTE